MIPRAIDSLEVIEVVLAFEEFFGIEVPNNDSEGFASPREIVDWLELHLSNERPNKNAAAYLKKLAKKRDSPALAEGLHETWRREQIAAIVREIFQ
jgi:acyl carrier protein